MNRPSPDEARAIERFFSFPDLIPQEFKGWLQREIERNPPRLLRTDIAPQADAPWTDVAFNTNWAHPDASHLFQYRVQPHNTVELRGQAVRTNSVYVGYPQLIATLPTVARPAQEVQMIVGSYDAGSTTFLDRFIVIETDGEIKLFATADGNADSGSVGNTLQFDGITFPAA